MLAGIVLLHNTIFQFAAGLLIRLRLFVAMWWWLPYWFLPMYERRLILSLRIYTFTCTHQRKISCGLYAIS